MRLVLISLDACFQQDAETFLALPNMARLTQSGVFCDNVQTVYPTLTYPIHTSIITGCYPDTHGIGHNEIYAPNDVPGLRPWHWDEKDIQVPTLFSAAYKAGREVATLLWPVTGHARGIKYNFPEVLALPWENQVLKVLKYGSALWLLKNELKFGKQRVSTQQPYLDRYATLLGEQLIYRQYAPKSPEFESRQVRPSHKRMGQNMPDVLALHLVDCDAMRHQYGVHSPEAEASLVRLDQLVGRILQALDYRDALKDTIVAVVSDHGQDDVTDSVDLNALFEKNSVPCRAHSLGFGAYIDCDRAEVARLYQYLSDHKEEYSLSHVHSREELRELRAPKEVLLAVEAMPGVEILESADMQPHRANHGFGLHHPGARTLLWLSGPMFKQNARLEKAHVVDIAPTLAEAAGLYFPPCEGRVLKETFH